MFNVIYGTQVIPLTDARTNDERASEIVRAFIEGMRSSDLSTAITLIKNAEVDGTWCEVRTLVNETLSLFYVETESKATILSEHTGCGIWSGPTLFSAR